MTGPVGPGITVRRDGLLGFLRSVDGGAARPEEPTGLCLLSGRIVARNLRERVATGGPSPDLVSTTTVEDLAAGLLSESGRPARVLDPAVRKRALAHVLETAADHDTPLGRFARRVPFESGDVLEGVAAELDDYYRCTDAGEDPAALRAVVDDVEADNPFAAETTRESLRAFDALDRRLGELVDRRNSGADDRVFRSRSHLVRAARAAVDDAWVGATGDPEWVALATVSALDAPTLEFLLRIARRTPLVVFPGAGTADGFRTRFSAAAGDLPVRFEDDPPADGWIGADPLAAAADHDPRTAPEGVRTVAVPDPRREVEYAVRAARAVEGSTLLVAPDAGEYATPLRDVALTRDRPYRVETRREVRTLPAFRGVTGTVGLLAAAEDGPVRSGDLVAGVERGFLPPGVGDRDEWPPSTAQVRALRAATADGNERSLSAWRGTLVDADADLRSVRELLAWVDRNRESPPGDGAALRSFLTELLDAHVRAVADQPIRDIRGIAVETGRARASADHPAADAARVREAAATAARTYDWLLGPLDRSAGWETALAAVRRGAGSETYGVAREDADAVEVVDAGNAYFRRVDRAFVLGLAAGRFPRTPRRPSFLHRAVREAAHRRRESSPFLYLDGQRAQYERDLDAYGAALSAAREGVTLVRPYKDGEGRDVAPSPFLDALSVPDERHTRVDLGDWIALGEPGTGPESGRGTADDGEFDRLWAALSDKERLRALAGFSDGVGGPDEESLRRLADGVAGPADRRRIRRRIRRFRERVDEDRPGSSGEEG